MLGINKYRDNIDIVGTTVLLGDNNQVDGLGINRKNNSDVILIPQPSSNPNDPLNWSLARKRLHFGILWFFGLVLAAASNWTGPVYGLFAEVFGVSYNQLNIGSGLQFIFLALSCLLSQPLANKFGRRPTYILSTILTIIASVIFASKRTYSGYMGYSIINGLAIGPIDTLIEVSVADIFFLDQHGSYIGLYSLALGLGSSFGPLISGYVAKYTPTWTWSNYIIIIICGSLLIVQVLFLEESLFHRQNLSDSEGKLLRLAKSNTSNAMSEKEIANLEAEVFAVDSQGSQTNRLDYSIPKKTFLQKMALLSLNNANEANWYSLTIAPIITLRYPAVLWTSICYGLQICWLSLLSVTQAQFFAGPPYFFSTEALSNLSLAGVTGTILGFIYILLSDPVQVYLSRRNKGISEPEFRLSLFLIPTILNTLGIFLYGYGPAYQLHWIVGAIGIGLINVGITCLTSLSLTYVMESYPKQTSKTMVATLFVRNIVGSIFNWVFQIWFDGVGIKAIIAMLGVFCFFINGSFIIMYIWGKNFRKMTQNWYQSAVQD